MAKLSTPFVSQPSQALLNAEETTMFKTLLRYIPLGPLLLALVVFVLLPFESAQTVVFRISSIF